MLKNLGTPDRVRSDNLRLRRSLLYPVELQAYNSVGYDHPTYLATQQKEGDDNLIVG